MAVDLTKIQSESKYSVAETAKFLEKTDQTVRLYIKNGQLKAEKGKDSRWRIKGSEIIGFINGGDS